MQRGKKPYQENMSNKDDIPLEEQTNTQPGGK